MGRRQRSQPWQERLLGGSNSWRRVVSAGIAGGIVLAIFAALVSSICSGGSSSLEDERPTVAIPDEEPRDVEPPEPVDTLEPTATDVLVVEPTPTQAIEPSPTVPEPTETQAAPTEDVPPTPEPTASLAMADY